MASNQKSKDKSVKLKIAVLVIICIAIAGILSVPLWLNHLQPPAETVPTAEPTTVPTTAPTTEPTTEPTAEPTTEPTTEPPTEPQMLPEMAELYEQNPDIGGWLTVEGTVMDFPVMYTPEDEEKYIYSNFEGSYDWNGLPFIGEDCSFDPETQCISIYAHNKVYGGMFHDLLEYDNKDYWEKHRYINFKTLYEDRTYEVFAAFDDKVYLKTEDVFKFYNFIDPETEEEFNEGIAYFKEKTKYDMDVDVSYGDRLLMLITCSYRSKYGRYVVVAKEVTEELPLVPE